LYWYNSRWYDDYLNRWCQPDSIIPDTGNPQSLDRYAYSFNNPIKYVDPTGHTPLLSWQAINPILIILGIVTVVGVIAETEYDKSRQHAVPPGTTDCQGTLSECFNQHQVKDFSYGQKIDQNEFNDMLDSVSKDLDSKWRTPFDPARATYDTPFFDGNSRFGDTNRPDQLVCIGDKCSLQSSVNYVAEGMYSAKTGQSLDDAKKVAAEWNSIMYRKPVSDDELYWLEYGYDYYERKNQSK
jgi:hypothetical protein